MASLVRRGGFIPNPMAITVKAQSVTTVSEELEKKHTNKQINKQRDTHTTYCFRRRIRQADESLKERSSTRFGRISVNRKRSNCKQISHVTYQKLDELKCSQATCQNNTKIGPI